MSLFAPAFLRRAILALTCLAGLSACGYKGNLYLPPPPPPSDTLTQPPATPAPAVAPAAGNNRAS